MDKTLSQITKVFSSPILSRGQSYYQKGYVLSLKVSEGLLKSRVKSQSGPIYDVHIDLKTWPLKPAHCSCPFVINCKHAVASLLALKAREAPEKSNTQTSLDDALTAWLMDVHETAKPLVTQTHALVYLVDLKGEQGDSFMIYLALAKKKKAGLGAKIIFHSMTATKERYFTPDDEEIVAKLLFKAKTPGSFDYMKVDDPVLFEQILETGRAYLVDSPRSNIPLSRGPVLNATLSWVLQRDGSQKLTIQNNYPDLSIILADDLWYFNEKEHVIGRLSLPPHVPPLKTLIAMPSVPLSQIAAFRETMKTLPFELPALPVYSQVVKKTLTPYPSVLFDAVSDDFYGYRQQEITFIRDILFDYDGVPVSYYSDLEPIILFERDGILFEVTRDIVFEKKNAEVCNQLLPVKKGTNILRRNEYLFDDEAFIGHLHAEVIPALRHAGFGIQWEHPIFAETLQAKDMEWFSSLESGTSGFFNYELGILVEGQSVNVVPLIANMLRDASVKQLETVDDSARLTVPLPNGQLLDIEMKRIKPLLQFLLRYGIEKYNNTNRLEIDRYQYVLMQEMEAAFKSTQLRWIGESRLRDQLKQLSESNKFQSIPIPDNVKANLRDYQKSGLNWLQFLREVEFGGILADDMGLGKTLQTLAHLQIEKNNGRMKKASLIIAPTSLMSNWAAEAKRFVPELKTLIFHGTDRHGDAFDNYDVVFSTYGLVQRDKQRFIEYPFYYLILDEAQFIKNARTKTTQIIQQIQAKHRLCLSGTPMENHLGELWSLFHFIMPGLLGDAKQFKQDFRIPIERQGDVARQKLLINRVRPFMLRRTKSDVVKELPLKTEMTREVMLEGSQRDLYEAVRMSMEEKVREAIARLGMAKSQIVLLDALLKLRQVCCDPRLVSTPEARIADGNSAKLKMLLELVDNLMAENRRVLIFSQFTSMLQLIEKALDAAHYPYLTLTGQTKNRQQLVDAFQNDKAPIFLISLKAGGTGLNLTRADTVIHYDPWWNPAVEDQATGRSHRMGQENPVFVYKLITTGTVEEAILAMQHKKRQLFDAILSEDVSCMNTLTADDIERLFRPLKEESDA